MKNLLIAAVAATSLATASFAGGNSEAEMEPMVETAEVAASSSAAGLIVPILAILLLAAVASSGDTDTDDGGTDLPPT
jgi:hypothetical protein